MNFFFQIKEDEFDYTSKLTTDKFQRLDLQSCKLQLSDVDLQFVPTIDDTKICTQQLPEFGLCAGDIGKV